MDDVVAKKEISWPAVSILIFNHVLGIVGIYYAIRYPSLSIIVAAVVYFFLCHLSIAFLHRGFTHKAFRVAWPIAILTMTLFSAVAEATARWWKGKHIDHHIFSDIPGKDPHTPLDGFYHSQMGWLTTKEGVGPPTKRSLRANRSDSMDRAVLWQEKYHWQLSFLMIFVTPTAIGWLLGDALGGFLVIGFARLLFQNHCTWFVNSIGHTFGERPMKNVLATNFSNWPLGLPIFGILTVGESHHANHHMNANTWRLGTRWYHFDVAAWVIQLLIWLGLATDCSKNTTSNEV